MVREQWEDVAVPSIMYELKTTAWSKNALDMLDVVHKARQVEFGTNRYICSFRRSQGNHGMEYL